MRSRRHWLVWGVSCTLLAGMSACGQRDQPVPTEQPGTAPQGVMQGSAQAASAAAAAEPLRMTFVYRGPVGDGGWTHAHEQARQALEQEFGDRIHTRYIESVSQEGDARRVMRELAKQGTQLVFGTARRYGEVMLTVASEYPQVKFELAGDDKTAANLASYDVRREEGAYLAGLVAGHVTKSGTLGVVAATPTPDVLRSINGFALGAQRANPAVITRVIWVGDWFNPPQEGEATASLINGGADVVLSTNDSTAVLKTAEKMGKRGFGWNTDMAGDAPTAHLASVVVDWLPYYRVTVNHVLKGEWRPAASWWGVKEGAVGLASLAPDVPQAARQQVDDITAGLKAGTFRIWRGPLRDNGDQTLLSAGQDADDAMLRSMAFLVKGVEGKLPGR
ncbi:BMP family ABC transporter substrate-binding protein [Comamonas serinivorans]|uniref:BMP family ABC transporter substrate-binding protein n=1 Tax=Comamonas serinivorans TaxID=1082851 RepID=A0A1Y0EPE6_9BURK|nr:BMP family ABC transporter substrate-binding protein [Comamonas serinivorans]ARU05189.1 BMP family ABC transporter substrate-binding protein [Comamonas serinivorans]